jgi:hypothetical protein
MEDFELALLVRNQKLTVEVVDLLYPCMPIYSLGKSYEHSFETSLAFFRI